MSAAVAKDDAATDDEEATPDVAEADPVATQEALIKLIDANDFDAFAERLAADASIKNLAGGGGAGAAGGPVPHVKAVSWPSSEAAHATTVSTMRRQFGCCSGTT
mmetsp:Transcript_4809/g.15006  ORF Transcript_4809/g.15006 Transcript_4809/m.15006 type:complete len:105 (-) Transcript_4809:591-905(-)